MRTLIAPILLIAAFNVNAGDNRYQNRYNYQPQVIQIDPVQQYLIQQQAQQRDLEARQHQYFMQRNALDNYRREYVFPLRMYGY